MIGTRTLLARQLTVLRLCAGAPPQRFSTLRDRLGVSPSTVTRLLRGLEAVGLVRRTRDGYGLAPDATRLGLELLGHARPATAAEAVVADLARQTGASAAFWIIDGERMILAAKQEVPDGFHYIDRFAHRPLKDSAFGVALLVAMTAAERERRLLRWPGARRLLAALGTDGVFAGRIGQEPDYWRVAAAVGDTDGAHGALGISRYRRPTSTVEVRDRRCVVAAAKRLARELS